ncbi:adenylate cyclase [Arcanobacterium hippocoleae]|uniref:CYTH domain-containing protein n=1 Tax=Arcanobacterium hippocoleae TaxID=149017 RepID=A0ABU1T2K3_9ACTO|nr:adenylate cyclase [Arcanobacterium hippocoleae]MDR6939607.1 CYTH domain-containing protein [Arcanobacterium hippocoleae]
MHEQLHEGADGREIPFEFERKFFVANLPQAAREHGSQQIIVQAYVFAQGGYAIRVRLSFRGMGEIEFPKFAEAVDFLGAYERKILTQLLSRSETADSASVQATIAVKSPSVNGERYELEHEMDLDVAVQILQRSGNLVLKSRYSLWVSEDGWEFDVFAGQNEGLIVAECERLSPVVDLQIPDFAVTEVTADARFTNDSLAKEPWNQWDTQFRQELAARGPFFLDLRSA